MINQSHWRKIAHRASAWLLLSLFLLPAPPLAAQQKKGEDKEGAKQLFYNPATGAASQPKEKERAKSEQSRILVTKNKAQNSGIYYWIELEGVGKVTDDYVFRTGDRIKLHLRSNVDGYLSLWSYDPSGEGVLLFPSSEKPEDNQITVDSEFTLPGTIEFRPPVEDERLLIFFSKSQVDMPQPQTKRLTAEQVQQATESEGGKALVFETEKKDRKTAGTYVVNQRGGAIVKEIRLKHRPRKE